MIVKYAEFLAVRIKLAQGIATPAPAVEEIVPTPPPVPAPETQTITPTIPVPPKPRTIVPGTATAGSEAIAGVWG